ncbi:TRIM25 isoform 4, partial [Pongo abelii]
ECICHICLVEHKACSPASLSQASADLEHLQEEQDPSSCCQMRQ